jgi:hypothetical protein
LTIKTCDNAFVFQSALRNPHSEISFCTHIVSRSGCIYILFMRTRTGAPPISTKHGISPKKPMFMTIRKKLTFTGNFLVLGLLLITGNCIEFLNYQEKVDEIRNDRHEFSDKLPCNNSVHQEDSGQCRKILKGYYCGKVVFQGRECFDIAVDSILQNRKNTLLHFIIPVTATGYPMVFDTSLCFLEQVYEGRCGQNRVSIVEKKLDAKKIVDSIEIVVYTYKNNLHINDSLSSAWKGYPDKVHFVINWYEKDAIMIGTKSENGGTLIYQSSIDTREIRWVKRKKIEYLKSQSLALIVGLVEIPFVPIEAVVLVYGFSHLSL